MSDTGSVWRCPLHGSVHITDGWCLCGELAAEYVLRSQLTEREAEVEELRGSLEEWQLDFRSLRAEVKCLREAGDALAADLVDEWPERPDGRPPLLSIANWHTATGGTTDG